MRSTWLITHIELAVERLLADPLLAGPLAAALSSMLDRWAGTRGIPNLR